MQDEWQAVAAAIGNYQQALDRCLVLNAARNFLSPSVRAILGSGIADGDWSGHAAAVGGPWSAAELAQIAASARRLTGHLFAYPHV